MAIIALAVALLVVAAGLATVVVVDYQTRALVTKGVVLAGSDLSNMTEAQVRDAIDKTVSAPMLQPVTVTGDKKEWTIKPKGIVAIDQDAMVQEAYAPRRTATIIERLGNDLFDKQLPAEVKPAYSLDSTRIAAWVAKAAKRVDRKPIDATRKVVNYKFKITKSVLGAQVDQKKAIYRVKQALSADAALSTISRDVLLPVKPLKAKVLESSFRKAIIVSLPACEIYLYDGTKLIKKYPCAPGRPGFPTPTGDFVVDSKLKNAPWINPGSAWAASMPPYIGPGPDNPMGVRKIGIDYSGVFMHGVPSGEFGSIGTHASHGCMRMFPSDVADLFDRVSLGMPVYIRN